MGRRLHKIFVSVKLKHTQQHKHILQKKGRKGSIYSKVTSYQQGFP